MPLTRISLPMTDDRPGHAFTRDELAGCEASGTCCRCGACCWAHEIEGMPAPGDEPGALLLVNGKPVKGRKEAGELCPHLAQDDEGRLSCSIHDSPHRPQACGEWIGNGVHGYRRMLAAAFTCVTAPPSVQSVHEAALLVERNVFALLDRKPGRAFDGPQPVPGALLETPGDVIRVAVRYVGQLGVFDEAAFARLGVGALLEHFRRYEPELMADVVRGLRFACFSYENPLHRRFVETYLAPEQEQVWA